MTAGGRDAQVLVSRLLDQYEQVTANASTLLLLAFVVLRTGLPGLELETLRRWQGCTFGSVAGLVASEAGPPTASWPFVGR